MVNMTFDEIIAKLDKLDELSDKIAERIPKSLDDEEHPKDIYTATAIKFILLYLKRYDCLCALMDVLKSDAFSRYYKNGYSRFYMGNSYQGFDKKKPEVKVNEFRKVYASKIYENEYSKTILQFLEKFLLTFCRDYFPVVDYVMYDYTSDTVHDNPNVDEYIKQWESSCFNGLLRSMIDVINMIPEKSYLQYYPQIVDYFAPHSHVYENYDFIFHDLKIDPNELVFLDLPNNENKILQHLDCNHVIFFPSGTSEIIPYALFSDKPILFYEKNSHQRKVCSIIQYIIFASSHTAQNGSVFSAPYLTKERQIEYYDLLELISESDKKPDMVIKYRDKEFDDDLLLDNWIDPQTGRYISIDFSIGLNDFLFHDKEIQHIKNGIIEKIVVFADCTILFYNLAKTKDSLCFIKANHLYFKDSDSIRPDYNKQQKELLLSEIMSNKDTQHVKHIALEEISHNSFSTIYNRFFKLSGTNVSGIVRTVFNRHLLDNDFSDIFSEFVYSIAKYARIGSDLESKFPIVFENGEEEVLLDNIPHTLQTLLSLYKNNVSSGNIIVPEELANFGLRLLGKENGKVVYNPFAGYGEFIPKFKEFVYIGTESDNLLSTIDGLKVEYSDNGGRIRKKEIEGKKYDRIISFLPLRRGSEKESMTVYAESIQQVCHTFDLSSDSAKAVLFLSADFLYCKAYENIRHQIIDNRWLDTIIYLPDSIYGKKKLRTVALLLNKKNNPVVSEFDFTNFTTSNGGDTVFRYDDALDAIELANNFHGGHYFNTIDYGEITDTYQLHYPIEPIPVCGQYFSLSEILQYVDGERTADTEGRVFESRKTYDYLDCIKESTRFTVKEVNTKYKRFASEVYILPSDIEQFQPILCKATSAEPIFIDCDRYYTYTIQNPLVNPSYLTWILCHSHTTHQLLMRCHLSTIIKKEDLDTVQVVISSLEEQRETIKYAQKSIFENKLKEMNERLYSAISLRESDARSLKHSLGAPISEIYWCLKLLEICCKKNGYLSTVASKLDGYTIGNCIENLRDRMGYISALISGGRLDNIDDYPITEVTVGTILPYLQFKTSSFKLKKIFPNSESSIMQQRISINPVLLQVCFGNVFMNAEKHAFMFEENPKNIVEVEVLVEYENFVVRIKNNGQPFPDGFTQRDFELRGRTAGKNAGNGDGGYDISRILQHFNAKFVLHTAFSDIYPTCYEMIFPLI